MSLLVARRSLKFALFVGFTFVAVVINGVLCMSLWPAAYWSGWFLLIILGCLALYSVRKKLVCVPLGSASLWLQLHVYGGLFSFVVFLMHTGIRAPNGIFESVLAAVYLSVFSSGFLGLLISRTFARRLTARGSEVVYERIPDYRLRLKAQVERLLARRFGGSDNGPVTQFYLADLQCYFEHPCYFFHHILESTGPQRALLNRMESYKRCLNSEERDVMSELETHVRMKDDLDYQYALQFVLKYWPFIHVPLTYSLLLLSLYHAVLVHAYSGSM